MAPPKRKRNPTNSTANKRQKTAPPSTTNDDKFYQAKGILAERRRNGRVEYLVDWEPDSLTGEIYEPDWQPRGNCTESLVAEWQQKQKDAQSKSVGEGSELSSTRGKSKPVQLPLQPPLPPKRKSRVVESSPSVSSTSASLLSPPTAQPIQSQTPAPISPPRPRASPQVHVDQRKSPKSSFQYYSQLPASPSSSISSARRSFLSSQSSYTGPRKYRSSGIVYDSEDEDAVHEAASFVPTTQEGSTSAGPSTQQLSSASKVGSSNFQGSDLGAKDRLQDYSTFSPLFEPDPASPALSIPISIPETESDVLEHDTIEDSQVQPPHLSLEYSQADEQREIPESLDIIVTTSQPTPQELVAQSEPIPEEELGLATNEEALTVPIADEEPGFVVAEDESPTAAQESELLEQTTLRESTAEPFQVAAQPEEEIQAALPELPTVSALTPSEPACLLLERELLSNEDHRNAAKESELELGPPHTEIIEDAGASPGDLPRQLSPSASPIPQEEPQSAEQNAQQPSLAPTTEASSASSRLVVASTSARPEPAENVAQPALENEVAEHSCPASVVPSVQVQRQISPPNVEGSPARETQPRSQSASLDIIVQASQALQNLIHDTVESQAFVLPSNQNSRVSTPHLLSNPTPSPQHAQRVHTDAYLSTQDEISESIRPTIEKDEVVPQGQASPQSRHDSSQESPEPLDSSAPASSPLPPPPSHSLGTLATNAPSRPRTPAHSFQSVRNSQDRTSQAMATPHKDGPATPYGKTLKTDIDALFEETRRENPFVPKRNLKTRANLDATSGTRSPSTIPDREPMPQVPTSLRTVAVSNSMAELPIAPEAGPSELIPPQEEGESGTSDSNNVAVSVPAVPASTDEELSDADDASVLNDDLQLGPQEYIVPLPMDGRQASMYRDELKNNQEVLKAFMNNPDSFEQIDKVDRVFQRLQAIETHIDLVFSPSQPSQDIGPSTQLQHQTQWSLDNAIKFRFIGTLLHRLQDRDMHVILVLEKDDARMIDLVENFMRGKFIDFKCPTRGHQANAARVEGNVVVTILPRDSTPIVRPPHLIICLNGHVDAGEIRKKNWAANPDLTVVPLLHLVIPRTVDHIVRYASPTLGHRQRLHTIFATLAQLHAQGEIGRAMSHTLMPSEAADEIVQFLTPREDGGSPVEWPLPSIGSIKDVIEFQSQQSMVSPPRAASAAKRPLEDDTLDPAKRMRFTPQPGDPISSTNNEVTHISDSMPGTAIDHLKAQQQLTEAMREIKRLRDREASWSKQQVAHEERGRSYVQIKVENSNLREKLEAINARETTLRERLETRTTEYRDLQARHQALEDTKLLSEDEKTAEITRLRKDLASAKELEQRALKSKQTAEESFDYVKEQYRTAQDAATTFRDERDDALAKIIALTKQASGEVRGLAQLHYDRQEKLKDDRETQLLSENRLVKQLNGSLTEEVARLKNGRGVGVGTRAQSSRPGSRAASPVVGGYRDRLANLRNG
jgi:hypothetical protein